VVNDMLIIRMAKISTY